MKQRSEGFKNQIKLLGREIDSKVTYTQNGETIELGAEELNSITPSFKSTLLKSCMKELEIDSNVEIPLETVLTYQFGLKVNGEYEYLNYGNYIVNKVEKQEDTRSWIITCYDKMLYSMKDYEELNITYPTTIREYIIALCSKLGLVFKNREEEFCNYDKPVNEDLFINQGLTFRDVLDQLAEVTGSIICINNNDELELRYISSETPPPTRPSKNIINTQGFQNGYINASGSFVSDNKTALLDYEIPVEADKTYCFSTNANVDNMVISMFGSNDNFLRRQKVSNTNKLTQLMANDVSYVRFAVNYNNSSTMTQEIIDNLEIMGELGSNRTIPYESYGPVVMGKNLLNVNEGYERGYLNNRTERWVADDKTALFTQDILVEPGETYCVSANWAVTFRIYRYDEEENYLGGNTYTGDYKKSITIPEGTYSILIACTITQDEGDIITDEIIDELQLMFEKGVTDRTVPYEPYVEPQTDLDTINEEYLKDISVKFGEKFGPVNSIVLSRSAESDNIYIQDEESIELNGLTEIKIKDNQFMNFNNRDLFLQDLLETLDGLEFYINDFSSTGIAYLELCDLYNVEIEETKYKCLMLNDTMEVSQGLTEDIFTELPEKTETDYKKSDKTDNRINQAFIIVDKQEQQIQALTSQVETLGDGYTKEEVNQLIQTATDGVTNKFITSGGNNILRNTGLWFEDRSTVDYLYPESSLYPSDELFMKADPHWEYWTGNAEKEKEDEASNLSGILLKTGYFEQTQQVRSGTYTLSFKYKKINLQANANVKVGDKYIYLTESKGEISREPAVVCNPSQR